MNTTLLTSVLIFVIASVRTCSTAPSQLDRSSYIEWVEAEENGIHLSKKVSDFTFEVQFKPLDYLALQNHPGKSMTEKELKKEKDEMSDMQYFTFRISNEKGGDLLRNDASTMDDFSSRLAYFTGKMQEDLSLIEGKDTLHCLLFHFERTYGIDPRSTFVLGFPLAKKEGAGGLPSVSDKIFFYNDHELGTGPVLLKIDHDNLEQIPSLNLN